MQNKFLEAFKWSLKMFLSLTTIPPKKENFDSSYPYSNALTLIDIW